MKHVPSKHSRAAVLAPIVTALLACMLPFILAEMPAWWRDRGVVKTDAAGLPVAASDFAAANQGQLKEFAIATYEEFLAKIPAELGGIGSNDAPPNPSLPESPTNRASPGWRIRQLVSKWVMLNGNGTVQRTANGKRILTPGASSQKDFAAINLGQIKAVAAPFYDRLWELYWSYNSGTPATSQLDPAWAKPWTDAPGGANDHAMATLGQLKNTFAIHLDSDGDGDGLTNLAELLANRNRSLTDRAKWTHLGNAYTTGGALNDGEQVALGLDPTNPVNGAPPSAPSGIHITFRDADAHPEDPDLSLISVEWDAPVQAGITTRIADTYAGNPAGWSVPVPPPGNTPSKNFNAPFSKRIYQYRVTFKAPNGLTASIDIAYELPVIRGIVQRQSDDHFKFPGVLLYSDDTYTGVPRKFRTYKHTWSYDETFRTNAGVTTSTHHEDGFHTRKAFLSTRSYSVSSANHKSWTYPPVGGDGSRWSRDRTYTLDNMTEPGPLDPNGSVTETYTDSIDPEHEYNHASMGTTRQIQFGLGQFAVVDENGDAKPLRPFVSLSGSDIGDIFSRDGPGSSHDYNWNATPTLLSDGDGQHLQWSGTATNTITLSGPPSSVTSPRNFGSLGFSMPYLSDRYVGICDNYRTGPQGFFGTGDDMGVPVWGVNPPNGAKETTTPSEEGTGWTHKYTYPDPSEADPETAPWSAHWTETITFSDEVLTTQYLVDDTLATRSPISVIGWYVPHEATDKHQFTNSYSVDVLGLYASFRQFSPWLNWDYSASYTSGAAGADLSDGGSAGWPVDGYVTVPATIGGLVGQYSLAADEAAGRLLSSEYKFRIYPPAESCQIQWLETFTPDEPVPRPAGWTPKLQYKVRTRTVLPDQTETQPAQTVDRTQDFPSKAGTPSATQNQQGAAPVMGKPGQVNLGDLKMELLVDSNHDGAINDGDKGKITKDNPWRFWLNDDDDLHDPEPFERPDHSTPYVDGPKDLEDFFPVFLDIQQLVKGLPPGATVKLTQEDEAVNFVETNLMPEDAFEYRRNPESTDLGLDPRRPISSAFTQHVTASGVPLSPRFLSNIRNFNRGVILVEASKPTTKPLVLIVETGAALGQGGAQFVKVSLPLSTGPNILLLLHGMNSNTATWDEYVKKKFGSPVGKWARDIFTEKNKLEGDDPSLSHGIRCYRLQFGGYENPASKAKGLEEDVTVQKTPNYLKDRSIRCGDFETFEELGQEIDKAISFLIRKYQDSKYPDGNIQVVLLGHSRGGIAARKFLEMKTTSEESKKVVVGLITTGSPHLGLHLGRIYKWLDEHKRNAPGTPVEDWKAVDFLIKKGLDVRRPVIGDLAEGSEAIRKLNRPDQVRNMSEKIAYREIRYGKVALGYLAWPYNALGGSPFFWLPHLSAEGKAAILGKDQLGREHDASDFPGDGCVTFENQSFIELPGFRAKNRDWILYQKHNVYHTQEPGKYDDLHGALKQITQNWLDETR